MTSTTSNVFIAFQANEESRPVVDAILQDNPQASAVYSPGLVKIDAPGRLSIQRATIEEHTGQPYDLQQLHVNLVTLSGNIDEDDDQLTLSWGA
ncbi:MmoB/DmpM family protein [Kerstersia gyiorum]|jgi:phenol hydroxylase P2 protein|uniref:Monooxygenase n=1 Tax=Kerstersia gyiorum TaxID=206506 RepID=A0A171KPE0_9BURK|nr:MmoB/DmpM family protein [Kerstersia gyiorum]AZV93082.1 monooxygenase [Bordetella sp. J329]MCO7636705.1 MmoB/DmpM family protein [Pseudomonas sp. S 311-6]KAB0544353.1 monooxygenase [Kerstersia gyiorum]KKO70757.1 monooxygenase [Kerstersia gyiorum]MCI1229790.1 MmoB/DmpM family protein [Kerstersia gyiorum]